MANFESVVQSLSKDPAVWTRVQSELSTAHNPSARLVELAREYGIDLDVQEIERAVRARSQELSEGELDSVSGGFNPQPDPPGVTSYQEQTLVGLLLPAVQKVRG
jgi:hypothetical protein